MGVRRIFIAVVGIKYLESQVCVAGATPAVHPFPEGFRADNDQRAVAENGEQGPIMRPSKGVEPLGGDVYLATEWEHWAKEDRISPYRGPGLSQGVIEQWGPGYGLAMLEEKLSIARPAQQQALLRHYLRVVEGLRNPNLAVMPSVPERQVASSDAKKELKDILFQLNNLISTSKGSVHCLGARRCPPHVLPVAWIVHRVEVLLWRLASEGRAHDMCVALGQILPPIRICLQGIQHMGVAGSFETLRDNLLARVAEQDRALESLPKDMVALAETNGVFKDGQYITAGAGEESEVIPNDGTVFSPVIDPSSVKQKAYKTVLYAIPAILLPVIIIAFGAYFAMNGFVRGYGEESGRDYSVGGSPSAGPTPPVERHYPPYRSESGDKSLLRRSGWNSGPSAMGGRVVPSAPMWDSLPPPVPNWEDLPPSYEDAVSGKRALS